jgi:hypothetical protein
MAKKVRIEKALDEIMADLANFLAICDVNREFGP